MPTSYTDKIINNISFRDFVLNCAMAFGACINQRDTTDKSPKLVKLDIKYHRIAIKRAKIRLKQAQLYTDEKIQLLIDSDYKKRVNLTKRLTKHYNELKDKYAKMLKLVELWTPPTSDHYNLKSFMISQINESIKFDCGDKYNINQAKLSVKDYRNELLKSATYDIKYHTEQIEKEKKNVETRNKWITDLYNSLA